jgi:hypothetical protein
MTADQRNGPADVRLTSPGPGVLATFLCPRCAKSKSCVGRKLQRVRGLRTWVCRACAR